MMAVKNALTKGDDGFYHPANEDQIIYLIKKASAEGLQIRCRGAAHSIAWAIYTDPGKGNPPIANKVSEQQPPSGPNINIMLDRYTKLAWIDVEKGIVEVEAGIHLGVDPEDPAGTSTWQNSLLGQAFDKGWTLGDLGGITHQTVSGFLSTGSAGGSLTHDLDDNIQALRVIDGTGQPQWIAKDSDEELFHAMRISLGLLGIISKVRLQLTPNYYIYGQEITTPAELKECAIDLYGSGRNGKPSLQEFLLKTPYTRILWWPQQGIERIVTWQAVRGNSLPVFDPIPYKQFGDTQFSTELMQIGGAILFTLLGNRSLFTAWRKLGKGFKEFNEHLEQLWQRKCGKFLGWLFATVVALLVKATAFILVVIFGKLKSLLHWLYPKIVELLQPLTKTGTAKAFMDYAWRSLPMDNAAGDILLGTEFTEIFIPLSYTERVMQLLRKHFDEHGITATGYYATELYAGYKSKSWLSPSYQEDTVRVDVFWYINNEGNPAGREGFFKLFWDLFRANNIPFRLHWGKFLPEYDFTEWAAYFRSQYPKWDDFMALRAQRDPKNIFLTDYWRRHLCRE
jgi:D-arabinono-1,4-lactone oxidase